MVSFRLQSILASMAKYYWILHYLSLLLSRLKHSFICKGVIGQNADIHYRLCAQDEIRRTHVNLVVKMGTTLFAYSPSPILRPYRFFP